MLIMYLWLKKKKNLQSILSFYHFNKKIDWWSWKSSIFHDWCFFDLHLHLYFLFSKIFSLILLSSPTAWSMSTPSKSLKFQSPVQLRWEPSPRIKFQNSTYITTLKGRIYHVANLNQCNPIFFHWCKPDLHTHTEELIPPLDAFFLPGSWFMRRG